MKGIGERNNMEEWKEIKISDICTRVTSGGTPKSTIAEYYGGSIPWLNTKEVNFNRIYKTEKFITDLGLENSSAKLIVTNSIVVAMYGATAGKSAIIKIPLTTNQACCNLTIDPTKADYRFVYYALYNDYDRLASFANGGAQQNLNAQQIKDFHIPYPSLEKQKRIVNILSSLDDKIELNNRINTNLEEQAQALFRRWFVDFEFPNEQGLPYKSNGGSFVDSELGKIPEGWKIGCIGDYCKAKSGFAFKSNWWTDKGVKVIKIKNINSDNTLNINDCSYVSEDIALLAKDFYVSDGDLLIAMTGATIGKFAIVVSNEKDLLVNQRVGKFFLGEKPLKKLPFIYNALKQNKISETIINKGQGSAQPNISSNDIESIEIPYSPNILIKKFNETCYPLLYQIIHNQKQNMELTQLRDTLLPRLMNNQIKI